MFLSQLKSPGGDRAVAARDNDSAWIVPGARTSVRMRRISAASARPLETKSWPETSHACG